LDILLLKSSVRAGTYARDADCLFLTEKSLLMLSVLFKVYGAMVDSGFPEHEIAASDKEKVSNLVPLVPTHGIIQSSEAEYCGICSNPIFTVYLDSVGNVAKVEVDEDEVLSRRSGLDDLELVSSRLQKVLEDQVRWKFCRRRVWKIHWFRMTGKIDLLLTYC
jgi:hypothetical protein